MNRYRVVQTFENEFLVEKDLGWWWPFREFVHDDGDFPAPMKFPSWKSADYYIEQRIDADQTRAIKAHYRKSEAQRRREFKLETWEWKP